MDSSLDSFPNEQILNSKQTMPGIMSHGGSPQECDLTATITTQDVTIL